MGCGNLSYRAKYFNPRSPCGERPLVVPFNPARLIISTHAPRAGSDQDAHNRGMSKSYFNPRSPCGERRQPPGIGVDE